MKNKLAFSTLGCPDWSFEKIVAEASHMGFSAIEVRGVGKNLQTDRIPCFFPENRESTLAMLTDAGISICGIGTSVSFHDASCRQPALEEGRRAIDICRVMGIPSIRVFGDVFPLEDLQDEVIDRVASGIGELCGYAESGEPVQVLLEIHGEFNTIEAVRPLIDKLHGFSTFGFIWDIEHSFRAYGKNFEPLYREIRPLIRHVHVKDCQMVKGEADVLLPGKGDINIPAIIAVLEEDGYDGYYSFEWEKRWHPEIQEPEVAFPLYVKYMNTILRGDDV